MTDTGVTYPIPAGSLPDTEVTWLDSAGAVIDLTLYTITEVQIGKPGRDAAITQTSGFTRSATAPNLVIAWDADEFDALTPSTEWVIQIEATRTVDSKKRYAIVPLTITQKEVV